MLRIHPQARTTPAVRADIARSSEPTSVLARRYGISDETVRKWRRRGSDACQDRSSRPGRLAWKASEEERAIVCQLRRSTCFGLDDLTFVVRHFLPHLKRDNIWRILKATGLSRLPPAPKVGPVRGQGTFRNYDPGYVHIDVKHLPKLQTADGDRRKRFLYVAIDRCSRSVHLAVYDAENSDNAVNFLKAVKSAFPFRITHILTDRAPALQRTPSKKPVVTWGSTDAGRKLIRHRLMVWWNASMAVWRQRCCRFASQAIRI